MRAKSSPDAWLEHYAWQGVDTFVLIDNISTRPFDIMPPLGVPHIRMTVLRG